MAQAESVAPDELAPPPDPDARKTGRYRDLFVSFRSRDFRYLSYSTLALGFAQWAQFVGLAWLALDLTGSAAQVGGVTAIQGGIGIVASPIAGYLADRYPRRQIIIWSTALSAIQSALLAALTLADVITVWQLYALALAVGALQSFSQPARQSFVYDVSTDETLVNAVTMSSLIQNMSRTVAPVLAGAMIGLWGPGGPFVFIAVMNAAAVLLTMPISSVTRQVRITGTTNPFREIGYGFRATWEDRRVLGLVVIHIIPVLFIFPYIPFLTVLVEDVHGGGEGKYAIMTSAAGWGAIIGLFTLAFMGDPRHKGKIMLGCYLAYSSLLIIAWTTPSFTLSLSMLALVGVVNSVAFALNNTLLQLAARNEVRGRIMAVWQTLSGFQPIGALGMGFAIEAFGVQRGMGAFMVTATVCFIVFTAAWGSVRRM